MKTFLARQALLNDKNDVVGYELLFRNSDKNYAQIYDGYSMTMKVIKDLIINFGIKEMTDNKRFFINFNEALMREKAPDLFNPEELVIQLQEDTIDKEGMFEIIEDYKNRGYLIALDGMTIDVDRVALIKLIDIIRLDFLLYSKEQLQQLSERLTTTKCIFLAEKVETLEDFEFAKSIGCTIFQGYYFQKPKMFESAEAKSIPSVYFELLDEINQEEVDFVKLASVVKKDTNLTMSLLKLMNSVAFSGTNKVTSVKQALVNLGAKGSQNLILINMLKEIAPERTPNELIKISLIRGEISEKLSRYFHLHHRRDELFIVGLLSLMNIIMRKHMRNILADMPLHDDVIDALLGEKNELSEVLEIIILHEMDDIRSVGERLNHYGIPVEVYNEIYVSSTTWADNIV